MHHVFLLPGFFGFTHLGEIVYFGHVRDFLVAELARRGVEASVVAIKSHPTASIRTRAREVANVMRAATGADGPIHLIGHSTGGLDARFLTSPGSDLGGEPVPDALLARIRTVVSVASPHRGSPLAEFFLGLAGKQILQLLSLFTSAVLRRRRLPIRLVLKIAAVFARLDDLVLPKSPVDQLFVELLSDLTDERREAVLGFLDEIGRDQALVAQLTPDAAELFSAATGDRPGVRYGCVVTRAARPNLRSRLAAGLSPYAQATHSVFALIHDRTSKFKPLPPVATSPQARALTAAYGSLPMPGDNDGIVPTLSQLHGEVIVGLACDHLDSIGHYLGVKEAPPHYDWMVSGSGFDRAHFEQGWGKVVDFLLETPPASRAASA